MMATRFEYCRQVLLHVLVVGLASLSYLIDPDDIVWALVRGHSNSALLERIAFGAGALVLLASAALETWAIAHSPVAAASRAPALTHERPYSYSRFPLRLARLLLAASLALLLPLAGAVFLVLGEAILVFRLVLRDRVSVSKATQSIRGNNAVWGTGFRTAVSKWALASSMILFTLTLRDRVMEVGCAVSVLAWLALNIRPRIRSDSMRMFLIVSLLGATGGLRAQDVEPTSSAEQRAAVPLAYVEHEFYLPDAAAMPRGLDTLEVRAALAGRHALALLTHGTSKNAEDRAQVTPWAVLPQALWFARRGYVVLVVVRRGYGRSGGEMDGRHGGCGENGSFTEAGQASAEDLRAAARYAAALPEVDASTVISAGVSTGGFAQVALSADPMPGLKTAISFAGGRGGDGTGHNCNADGLERAFRGFGKHSQIPMLWIYAENDKWFPPTLARRFDEAFKKGGGTEEFVMVPPDGEDGHHFYYDVAKWSPIVEGYLRGRGLLPLGDQVLPLPSLPNVPEPPGLSERGVEVFHHFLGNGPFKAFAINGAGAWGSSTGQFTQEIADRKALERCKAAAKGGGACTVAMR